MEEQQLHRCTICLSQPAVSPATVKECGHEYCLECLKQWCRTRRQPKCPLCQAEVSCIVHDGKEQEVPPPDALQEEGPDLGCLDHAYFAAESDRLLCRARAAQMHLVRSAYGCGRQGSSAADDASDTLQQVIDTLAGYREDMQREVPFQPESALHALYSLAQIVDQIAAGGWEAGGRGSGGGGAMQAAPAARFSADDAAAGFHGDEEDWWRGQSDDSHGGYHDDDDSEDDHGLDRHTRRQLERASLSSTPGRAPVTGRQQQQRRRGSAGNLAASRSSGSLSGAGGGAAGRRR